MIFALALFYSTLKAIELVSRHNPQIGEALLEEGYSSEAEKVSFKDVNLRFAFGVQDSVLGEDKLDPRYVKYLVRLDGAKDGVRFEKILSYHKCTDEDYVQFYPVGRSHAQNLESIKTEEKRGLYCVDEFDELEAFGYW